MAGLVPSENCEGMVCAGPSPWLVDGRLHVHMAFSLYVYVCVQILSLKKNIYLFIYFWLLRVFAASCRSFLVVASGGYCLLQCVGSLSHCSGFSYCGARALERTGLSSCGTQAWLPHSMWSLPSPEVKPVSPHIGRWTPSHWTTRGIPKFLL